MRILFGVTHPKHVYIFKNAIDNLIERGHEIKIVAVDKEITAYLLKKFNMPHTVIGKNQPNLFKKILVLSKWEYLTYKISKKFKPDIFVGRALPHLAHVSAIMNKPFIVFEDTEHVKMLHKITLPFADAVVTPTSYKVDHGKKHTRFDGYFELAYLHPNYFKPDPRVLDELGLNKSDKFIVLRFVSWNAIHDTGDKGFDNKTKVIDFLKQYGRVYITSESELPEGLKKYSLNIPPEKIHHFLYFATLYVGESATMATESAVLGTPSIFVSTSRRCYTDELENKYGLVYNYSDSKRQEDALKKASEILENENSKKEWAQKRREMLSDKMDVTKFMMDLIGGYDTTI